MCDLILFWWENIDHWSGSSYRIYNLYNSFPILPDSWGGGRGAGQEIGAGTNKFSLYTFLPVWEN